jgi:undecaprenyl phosphate-alpha-L-ara4N flippase subunit ArnE
MSASSFGLILFCIAAEIACQICFKTGVLADDATSRDRGFFRAAISPWLLIGIAFWAVEAAAWIVVLEDTPLHVAFPIMSLIYVGIPVASHVLLRERMPPRHWLGAALICGGVALIGLAGN